MMGLVGAALAGLAVVLGIAAAVRPTAPAGIRAGSGVAEGLAPGRRLAGVIGRLPLVRRAADPERMGERLRLAASTWSSGEIAGAGAALAVGAGALTLLAPAPFPLLAPLMALVGARLPGLALARRARRRRALAERELPVLLDLLSIATSTGLAPQLALRRVAGSVEGPLGEELAAAIRAVDLGGRWRDELALAAERVGSSDLRRTVATLSRSEALGSSLASEVTRLASDVRETRRAAATEHARSAPVKMLFPLVFLILPAFLLLTVVPVLVTTVQSIH